MQMTIKLPTTLGGWVGLGAAVSALIGSFVTGGLWVSDYIRNVAEQVYEEREERIRRASDDRLRQLRELQRSSPDVQTFTRLRTPADLCRLHAPAGREADCADGDGED